MFSVLESKFYGSPSFLNLALGLRSNVHGGHVDGCGLRLAVVIARTLSAPRLPRCLLSKTIYVLHVSMHLLCCGIGERRRSRTREVAPAPQSPNPPQPAELYEVEARDQEYFSSVATFADIDIPSRPRNSREQVVTANPYFGPFAGRSVKFIVDDKKTTVLVDAKKNTSQLDFTHGSRSVRDKCIDFLNATGPEAAHYVRNAPPPQPLKLEFLVEKAILLSGETPLGMSMAQAAKFNDTPKQSVFINVWPSSFQPPRAGAGERLKIKVPACLSFGELTYFMREKLSLPSSISLHLREPEGLYPLSPTQPLKSHHTELMCFVNAPPPPVCPTTSPFSPTTTTPQPYLLPVMMVGLGIDEVQVTPETTVLELESRIAELFGLRRPENFIYIQSLFFSEVRDSCRMFVSANGSDALALVGKTRKFPIALGYKDYHQLPLYKLRVMELGHLLQSPLICFCVNGPTVPITFRAAADSRGSGSHMALTFETRIISINSKWTASTLLKYIDTISRFPNTKLIYKGSIVHHNRVIGELFDRDWVVTGPERSGRKTISPSCLRIV